MYGLVNKAIEEMVIINFGPEVWERIKMKAGVNVDFFMSNQGYPDEMTYSLVTSASSILGISTEDVLKSFGEHWINHTAVKGYGGLLKASGKNLVQFMKNLPNFHSRVSLLFPDLKPPRFECTDINDAGMVLHYYSDRPGMQPFVMGLLKGLGKMYKTPVNVEQIEFKDRGADHDIFKISWSKELASADSDYAI
jgi:hypothetical protein